MKQKIITNGIPFIVSEFFVFIYIFLHSDMLRETNALIGIPIVFSIGFLGTFVLSFIIKIILKEKKLGSLILALVSIPITFLFVMAVMGFGEGYFLHKESATREYNQTNIVRVVGADGDVVNILEKFQPASWKLTDVYFDKENQVYWTESLEPSFLYGSVRHITAWDTKYNKLDSVTDREIYKQAKVIYSISSFTVFGHSYFDYPKTANYSNYLDFEFTTYGHVDKFYYLKMELKDGQIVFSKKIVQ